MANGKHITREQLTRIVRRLFVLAAIFVYIAVSFKAAVQSQAVLQVAQSPVTTFATSHATLIVDYVGPATIRESKLLTHVLGNSTTPRNDTLYLESPTNVSHTRCGAEAFDASLYSNRYMRAGYAAFIARNTYNLTHLLEYELIAPVVDCTLGPVATGDATHARVFYLLRRIARPDDVAVFTVTMAVQNYAIPEQHEEGTALVSTSTLVHDLRAASVAHTFVVALGYPFTDAPTMDVYTLVGETVDSQWILESVPRDPVHETTKTVHIATQRGLYLRERLAQSNIKYMHWELALDPATALSTWTWRGATVVRDSWAWVHYVHAVFGASTTFSVAVLFVVMYRNAQLGKIWIGDAFASVANSLMLRGVVVLVTSHFNEYWALTELCFAGGFDVADLPALYVYEDIVHADLLTLFLCSVHIVGHVTRTRIDPALMIVTGEVMFACRTNITTAFFPPSVRDWLFTYTRDVYRNGLRTLDPLLAQIAPLRLWTASAVPLSNIPYIAASVVGIFSVAYSITAVYIVATKLQMRFGCGCGPLSSTSQTYAVASASGSRRLAKSTSRSVPVASTTSTHNTHDAVATAKQTFTQFEIATGAELQNRFGLISAYDNFVFFKGLKFASADGIYCNGFVIANSTFLIATEDIGTIITMKLVQRRVRNVYTYEVDGNKLKQTAQLVYPNTFTWTDLLHLNVSILS